MNVFPYETLASDKEFFGRENEISIINDFINNSNNLVIFSKRRLGKTSLINEVMLRLEESTDDILCLYVDIYDITSAEDFATMLLQTLSSSFKGDIKTSIKKLTSLFSQS
mgnify:CR=1 FL=1